MSKRRYIVAPLLLLALFLTYQVSITLFTHVHIVNGVMIVHSHPSSEKHHTHTTGTGNLNCSSEHYPDSGARGADRDDCIPSCVVCFGIQDKYFPRESALCAMYPFARSSFLLLKHKVYLLTGYIRIIRSTDADVLLP